MIFHADLHVHSRHSRATSRDLDLEHLAWWAARKGIAVVGTGDCVHPVWLAELREKLIPAGGGLFRLKPEIERAVWSTLPASCRASVRFMLCTEISTIYKKGDKTRKVHHLIYAPDFETVDRLAARLARIGNIASDGRPILGLDSRDLLEVALQSGPDAYLVPAHIWTPWFAALGSQSGFDSIAECYGDLAGHIFAVETGLSSDPAMNWRVSSLDRYRLTSNSDAHSPGKLGREATRFACDPDYFAIRRALETGEGYQGTVEFFPEEGKYHMDGHRACGIRLSPVETIALGGLCPVCGQRVTVGVAHRVEKLADRLEADVVPPPTAGEVTSLVPLPEILSELVETGVASKAVTAAYDRATAALGPELALLEEVPVEDIARTAPLLGEAILRLRAGSVVRQPGYDGEYGVIRLFQPGELARHTRGGLLFETQPRAATRRATPKPAPPAETPAPPPQGDHGLDDDQARAAAMIEGPLIVLAGPGSGKTRMLTHRLAHLVAAGVPAARCLAITFTRRATEELRQRLAALLPASAGACAVHSFHSLGLAILRQDGGVPDLRVADERERAAALATALGVTETKARRLLKAVSLLKRTGAADTGEAGEALATCRRLAREGGWIDFDDLVALAVELLETHPDIAARWRDRFDHICVDEFQDLDAQQYRLLRLIAPASGAVCAIGDPNQAIYGFRGADAACFMRFRADFMAVREVNLTLNYRSTGTIVTAAARLLGAPPAGITRPMHAPITLHTAPDARAEAAFVAAEIARVMGGHDMLTAHSKTAAPALDFRDIAVLYRTDAQSDALREAFDRAGIPFRKSTPEPIAGQPAVIAALDALDGQDPALPLPARVQAAIAQVAADPAELAEARHWLGILAEDAGDAAALREMVALSTEADFWDRRGQCVSLLTMHAAKGLEFAVVFMVGLEDGLAPFAWEADAAEERRLFYVAMTRAKDRLILSHAARRAWRGEVRALPPSPFLGDIGADLLARQDAAPRRPDAVRRQYNLF